jgi:AraC family transcriptional regulator of arabinose operon
MESMNFEKYNKIIESLEVQFLTSSIREVQTPVAINEVIVPKNVLVQSRRGCVWTGTDKKFLNNDDFYFVPLGQSTNIRYGNGTNLRQVTNDDLQQMDDAQSVFKRISQAEAAVSEKEAIAVTSFFALIYGTIPMFQAMELPAIRIPYNRRLNNMINSLIEESEGQRLGRDAIVRMLVMEIVVFICRFIYNSAEYQEYYERLIFLADKRLVNMVQFIQENLDKELSNEKIAEVANVSKDYVGQFFKSVTKRNLQDYIEARRLERAHFILRTTGGNIQEISKKVGFKDQAYFSKRFKMMFNENAKDVRKIRNTAL